jgi:hypothetical protein
MPGAASRFWEREGGRQYEKVEEERLKWTPTTFVAERHTCTDILFVPIFALCIGATAYILSYALQNGDPRKVYHGMDYKGNLCGVDLPAKPYVYWCAAEGGGWFPGSFRPVAALDFEHPICVETCPISTLSQSECFDATTGLTKSIPDYATHAVGNRYCLPQSQILLDSVNYKMAGHVVEKYLPMVITSVKEGWPCLVGAFCLAFVLSYVYLLALECLAGVVMWASLVALVVFSGGIGANLIYYSQTDGVDGMPGSGDSQTDLYIGVACCIASAFFLLVVLCMSKAITKAVKSVESAASCMFHAKSLLLEPLLNLAGRIALWAAMFSGLAYLISTGEVETSKIYRSFTYTDEQLAYIVFYLIMMLWLNDFCNAMSQYVIANATAKWYFTEQVGGIKLVPDCLLCRGYISGFIYHVGSLAFGSLVIAFSRPLRMLLTVLLYAGETTDNALCGCLSSCCACCTGCFESFLVHLSKNAYIDMAITSKGFCASGRNAAQLLRSESSAIAALAGCTWLFSAAGLGSVTLFGSFIISFVVQNVDTLSSPLSEYYIQDPIVMAACAGVICFIVALGFMLVFDSVADTMLVCLAYDMKDQRENPIPAAQVRAEPPAQQTFFASFFKSKATEAKTMPQQQRPAYMPDKLQLLVDSVK